MLSASKMLRHASNFQGGVQTIWIFESCWHVAKHKDDKHKDDTHKNEM
jgi:hypothetical protein